MDNVVSHSIDSHSLDLSVIFNVATCVCEALELDKADWSHNEISNRLN